MKPRNETGLRFVPSSIQRVRCFLSTRGRMKVRPWADRGEVLEALRAALVARRDDEGFWKDIEELLASLLRDAAARAGCSVPNEVLDPARLGALIAEIRSAMPAGRGFRALSRALSAPAAALLLVMAGAATLGCEAGTSLRGAPDASADVAPDETPDVAPDETPDVPPDNPCPHEDMAIEEIVRECVPDEEAAAAILACLDALHASWRTGLAEYFECRQCTEISATLAYCFMDGHTPEGVEYCTDPGEVGEFDLETFLDGCFMPLYIGVRFG